MHTYLETGERLCGPGCEVEQCPGPIALKEGIEPLRESPRGLRILVGAGEHPGPREDFAAGVPLALGGSARGDRARLKNQLRRLFPFVTTASSDGCMIVLAGRAHPRADARTASVSKAANRCFRCFCELDRCTNSVLWRICAHSVTFVHSAVAAGFPARGHAVKCPGLRHDTARG